MNGTAVKFLTIRFVVVRNGDLRGELEPYWDPEWRCQATTTFTGTLADDRLRGTFVTEFASGGHARGEWQASQRRTSFE